MGKSILLAVVIAIAASAWIISGQFADDRRTAEAETAAARHGVTPATPAIVSVRVRRIAPSDLVREIVVNGRTEASRTVDLRAEIAGRIVEIAAAEGARLARGAVVARLATDDRGARLAEAQALLKQRQVEFEAARRLSKKGFRSSTKLAQARAYLDAAKALLETTRIALSRTVIRAPFDAVLEHRELERGAYAKAGDTVARLVDLDPVLVVGHVSERQIGGVRKGMKGRAILVGGEVVEGRVRYIAAVADPATRTFRVELEIANPDGAVRIGVTSELRLPLPPVRAHKVSPAVLTLGADGSIGVKVVGDDNRVRFARVSILAEVIDGVWLGGLPDQVTLITVGHEYVAAGQRVEPVFAAAEGAS